MEDRLQTLLELAKAKAAMTTPGEQPRLLVVVYYPGGHHQVMEAAPGALDLPDVAGGSTQSLARALEMYVLGAR